VSTEAGRETVVARLRPHGRALFWPTVLLVALAAAVGFFAGLLPEEWMRFTLLGVAALLALVGWLGPLLRWLARTYTITTRRVVVHSGILVRSRQEVLHSTAHDVTVRRSGLQAVFRSGDVLVSTGLDRPVVLADVPSADLVQAALHDLIEASPGHRPDLSIGY
jgi:membrane protein YdbS with pleckstrin-like domain